MKILQIMAGDEEGGLEKHFVELCNELSKEHDVHVIAHEKYMQRFLKDVSFHVLDLTKGRRNLFTLFKLFKIVSSVNPSIVHAHANKAVDMIARIRLFALRHIKSIATLHSKKKNLNSFVKFDHVIGVSEEVLKEVKNINKSVIYNGIALENRQKREGYLQHEFGIKHETFVICAVGRLEIVKNFALLISSIKDLDLTLLIVGEGTQREAMESLVKELNIEHKVIFTGYREDAVDIMRDCNLFVISSDREGLPYVFVESLICEIPVVSTDVSDIRSILPEFAIVPVGDKGELTRAIAKVQENYPDITQEYSSSFKFAKEHFTMKAMVDEVERVYVEVLNR